MSNKVTDAKLAMLGIFPDKNSLNPDRYYYTGEDIHIRIPKDATLPYVAQLIYELGFDLGVARGKELRSADFKKLINNEW